MHSKTVKIVQPLQILINQVPIYIHIFVYQDVSKAGHGRQSLRKIQRQYAYLPHDQERFVVISWLACVF